MNVNLIYPCFPFPRLPCRALLGVTVFTLPGTIFKLLILKNKNLLNLLLALLCCAQAAAVGQDHFMLALAQRAPRITDYRNKEKIDVLGLFFFLLWTLQRPAYSNRKLQQTSFGKDNERHMKYSVGTYYLFFPMKTN